MSSDLISRSALMQSLRNNVLVDVTSSLEEAIDEQPIAYDVDKVLEQLEDLKRRYWFTIANTGDKKLDCAYENVGNALDRTVEIVKSGGID